MRESGHHRFDTPVDSFSPTPSLPRSRNAIMPRRGPSSGAAIGTASALLPARILRHVDIQDRPVRNGEHCIRRDLFGIDRVVAQMTSVFVLSSSRKTWMRHGPYFSEPISRFSLEPPTPAFSGLPLPC